MPSNDADFPNKVKRIRASNDFAKRKSIDRRSSVISRVGVFLSKVQLFSCSKCFFAVCLTGRNINHTGLLHYVITADLLMHVSAVPSFFVLRVLRSVNFTTLIKPSYFCKEICPLFKADKPLIVLLFQLFYGACWMEKVNELSWSVIHCKLLSAL